MLIINSFLFIIIIQLIKIIIYHILSISTKGKKAIKVPISILKSPNKNIIKTPNTE